MSHASSKIAFVTNICPHYRVRTFETLSSYVPVKFYFFSEGREWYWQQQHGVKTGDFRYEYLSGFNIGRTRITPTLVLRLAVEQCDVFVKCINGRFALPITYLIARLRRKPFVLWTGVWMTLQTPFHRLIFPLTRYIYRHADAVVAYGEHVQRYLVSQGVAQQKIFVAPHAVDNEKHGRAIDPIEIQSLRDKLEVSNDQRIVLYLGRLEPQKGLGDLLQAFRLLRSSGAVLVFAGEGSERSRLEKLTEELGLTGRVRFAGYVPSQETPCYFAMAYVLVLPSITTRSSKETWGLVINEAMNQGCPVIATDAVGAVAGGLVQHDKNGFVVPEGCVSEFAGALQRLFDDPAVRQRLGAAAHRRIASWDNEGMVLGFRRALDYVMNKKSGVEEQPDTLDAPDHIPVVK